MENIEPSQDQNQKKSSSTLVTVLVLCVVIGAIVFFVKKGNLQPVKAMEKPTTVSSVMHLDTFTVNLSDTEQKAYLRLGVDLGLERDGRLSGESERASVALARDTILTILMATTPAEISTPEGKQKLKEQLLQSLQQRAPGLGVHDVFFTDFLVQQ